MVGVVRETDDHQRDNGEAILAGPIVDQAALHGLLAKLRDLGLPLIAVMPASMPERTSTD